MLDDSGIEKLLPKRELEEQKKEKSKSREKAAMPQNCNFF